MTFALGLALGLPLGAVMALIAANAFCAWLAGRDDDLQKHEANERS